MAKPAESRAPLAIEQRVALLENAIRQAIPFLFEHGKHVHPHCYRGSDDGCYCGLDEAKKAIEATEESR